MRGCCARVLDIVYCGSRRWAVLRVHCIVSGCGRRKKKSFLSHTRTSHTHTRSLPPSLSLVYTYLAVSGCLEEPRRHIITDAMAPRTLAGVLLCVALMATPAPARDVFTAASNIENLFDIKTHLQGHIQV